VRQMINDQARMTKRASRRAICWRMRTGRLFLALLLFTVFARIGFCLRIHDPTRFTMPSIWFVHAPVDHVLAFLAEASLVADYEFDRGIPIVLALRGRAALLSPSPSAGSPREDVWSGNEMPFVSLLMTNHPSSHEVFNAICERTGLQWFNGWIFVVFHEPGATNLADVIKNLDPKLAEGLLVCPHCTALQERVIIQSGNTFGARRWTDGKTKAHMMPDHLWFARCTQCSGCYWTPDSDWLMANQGNVPRESDFYEALAQPTTPEKEKYLRIRAWWVANDVFREDPSVGNPDFSSAAIANMNALFGLLGTTDEEDVLMKAEIARELGRFQESLSILSGLQDAGASAEATAIGEAAKNRISRVVAVTTDP
jgi:hypothetical protein